MHRADTAVPSGDDAVETPVSTGGAPTDAAPSGGTPSGDTPSGGTPTAVSPPDRGRRAEVSTVLRWAGDAIAVALLVAAFWYLENHDGGFEKFALTRVSLFALLAAPIAVVEAARLPRSGRVVLGLWGVGAVVGLAFAQIRADASMPAMVLGLVPLGFLAALRLWRRRWGPPVLIALLAATLGRYWYRSFLQWWGHTMEGVGPQWMALSWHNQSGMLMGAFGLLFAGMAFSTRRVLAVAFSLLAGGALAGAWLSGSRGAALFTAVALVVVAVAAWRVQRGERGIVHVATAGLMTLVVAVAAVAALTALEPAGKGGQPIANRDESAVGNGLARLHHMEAALGMFVADPLTGGGIGSYRTLALDHTPPNANLTSSAHDEYLEALGEGGILLALGFAGAAALLGLLALRRLVTATPVDRREPGTELRGAFTVGAVGVVLAVGAHVGMDFDFGYPVIPLLAAVAGAGLYGERRRAGVSTDTDADATGAGVERGGRLAGLVAVPVVLVLAAGAAGAWAEMHANHEQTGLSAAQYATAGVPWDLDASIGRAETLDGRGESELAVAVLDRTLAWNPGSSRARTLRAAIRYSRGELDGAALAASLQPGHNRFDEYIAVASRLISGGDYVPAEHVLDDVLAQLDRYRAWGVDRNVMDAYMAKIRLAGLWRGCEAAQEVADGAAADPAAKAYSDAQQALDDAVARACAV